eukprot:COSAG02_NODE_618_length_19461_cov_39.117447_6_plen_1075_part_00
MAAFEIEDGSGKDAVGNVIGANPLAPDDGTDAIAANESAMSAYDMKVLTYAFQAADMDGGGAIDIDEFSLMLAVMGCEMTEDQVSTALANAKAGFKKWCEMADAENVEKCQRIWDEYDDDKSGTMDLGEINAVINKLREMGSDLPTFTQDDINKMSSSGDGELNFEEFSRWFLRQEGLPDEFSAPQAGKPGGVGPPKEKGAIGKIASKASSIALKPLQGFTKSVVSGPAELLKMSARQNTTADKSGEDYDEEDAARAMMEEENELIFAEFVFMMRGGELSQFLVGNWQERAEDMSKLREAFDTADVDGDNELELEELEMVVTAMNPKADVQPADIAKVWAVLNPDGKDWIPFGEYVQGMIKVKNDKFLSTIVPLDVPNRFQLLSLLIDTPINEDQEKLIFDKMDPMCQWGINMLKKMEQPKQEKEDIRKTLDKACKGSLHYLTATQRSSVTSLHFWCVFQAFMIALVTCGIASIWENMVTDYFRTDGALDIYSSCPEFFADLDDPIYSDLSLPSNPGPWNGLGFTGDRVKWESYQSTPIAKWEVSLDAYRQVESCVPAALEEDGSLPDCSYKPGDSESCKKPSAKTAGCIYTQPKPAKGECLPGTCAAFPRNVTRYLEQGGNFVMGGTWNATEECWTVGTCTDDDVCPVGCVTTEAECADRSGAWVQLVDDPLTDDIDESKECWPGECVPLRSTVLTRPVDAARMVAINTVMVVVMIVFEIGGLLLTALRSAVKVSMALELRLTPLNTDRAFVAEMLVRSVFEMGDAEGDVMGVDAGGGGPAVSRPAIVNVFAVIWIKGRVLITGVLFKFSTCMFVNWDGATWLKPWTGPCLAAMMWDAMLCHAIMKGAEVQAIGVTTSVEVFNEIMDTFCPRYEDDPSTLSEKARVQILRAIGVAIVKHGSMFPTMELLLRHAVNYLNMAKSKAVTEGGIIDDEAGLMNDFAAISLDESRAVLCTHMLCYVLDGSIGVAETSMWKSLLARVEECYQVERNAVEDLETNPLALRAYITQKAPRLAAAVLRVPATGNYPNELGRTELQELKEMLTFVEVRGDIDMVACTPSRTLSLTQPISSLLA